MLQLAIRAQLGLLTSAFSAAPRQIERPVASSALYSQKPPIPAQTGSSCKVQVLKLLFRKSHWVDNLCQCENIAADTPEISGFARTKQFAPLQERYVSAAG